jgi:hypothetical protein
VTALSGTPSKSSTAVLLRHEVGAALGTDRKEIGVLLAELLHDAGDVAAGPGRDATVQFRVALATRSMGNAMGDVLLWTLLLTRLAIRLRQPLLAAGTIGLVVGSGCYLAGPLAASSASGICVALLTLSCLALKRLQGLLNTLEPGGS